MNVSDVLSRKSQQYYGSTYNVTVMLTSTLIPHQRTLDLNVTLPHTHDYIHNLKLVKTPCSIEIVYTRIYNLSYMEHSWYKTYYHLKRFEHVLD